MMLLDELIEIMIGMNDDQLRKIKSFILTKLSIKDPTDQKETVVSFCPHCHSIHIIRYGIKNGKQRFFAKIAKRSLCLQQAISPLKASIHWKHGQTMFQVCWLVCL